MQAGLRRSARIARAVLVLCIFIPLIAAASEQDARTLWVTVKNSVLKVAPADASTTLQLAGFTDPQALAVDDDTDTLWVYSQKAVKGYDAQGDLLTTIALPRNFHGGSPDGMAIDNVHGNIWLAIQKSLYRLDMGGDLKDIISLDGNAVGVSLDEKHSRLWVAEQDGIQVFDTTGSVLLSVPLSKKDSPTAIAFDKALQQVWVAFSGTIKRYDNSGQSVFQESLPDNIGSRIAVDGAGGLWAAGDVSLAHLDADTGQAQFIVQPLAGQDGGTLVALVVDVVNHTAWVANARHLVQVDINGSQIREAVLPLAPGNGQGIDQVGLYVDSVPPAVSITSPKDGLYTNNNNLPMALAYSDVGSGVDPMGTSITRDGKAIAFTCKANQDDSGAHCTPKTALADGDYSVSVTVQDYAGSVSTPAELTFTIDTVPPAITLTSPNGLYTNQPDFTLAGSVSEPGVFTINGNEIALDPAHAFSDQVVLTEGTNAFTFTATDPAGNRTTIIKTLILDTLPPVIPIGSLLSGETTNQTVTLTGQAGCAEAGTTAIVTNVRIGQTVMTSVAADGSFKANVGGNADDLFAVTLKDLAGNQSPAIYMHGTDKALQLHITTPSIGATINGDTVAVTGTFQGGINTGITVNGVPATVSGDHWVANNLSLTPGANTLTAIATTEGGLTVSQSVTVTSAARSRLILTATPESSGVTPFAATFQYQFLGTATPQSLKIDYIGSGSYATVTDPATALSYTYSAPGIYPVTLILTDSNNVQYQARIDVVVQDPDQMDTLFKSIWGDMTTALASGNKAAAMNTLDYTAKQTYSPAFDALLPHMKDIVGTFSPLLQSSASSANAEYIVVRNQAGQRNAYFVDFIKDMDGVWRIDSM